MAKVELFIAAFLILLGSAKGDKRLRRKRVLFSDGIKTEGTRGLNVLQDGTLNPDEDWDGFFFDASALSMSMSMPDKPKPPTPVDAIYNPISKNILNKFCRSKYGSTGLAVPDEDGVDWYCRVTDDVLDEDALYAISIDDVCQDEFGSNYGEVLLGGDSNHWSCVDWSGDDASYIVVPVLIIADDHTSNSNGTDDAISSVKAAMERVQSWYRRKMKSSKTFRLSQPILTMSDKSAEDWNELSCLTASPDDRPEQCKETSSDNDRFGYYYEAQAEAMKTSLPRWPNKQLVVIFVYTGPRGAQYRCLPR